MKAARALKQRIENMMNISRLEYCYYFRRNSRKKNDDGQQQLIDILRSDGTGCSSFKKRGQAHSTKRDQSRGLERAVSTDSDAKEGRVGKGDDGNFKGNAQGWQ